MRVGGRSSTDAELLQGSKLTTGAVVSVVPLPFAAAVDVPPADRYFDSAGVAIRYVEAGEGEPVVLVHGYTSDLESQWIDSGVFHQLARRHRTIAFDARGHGRSGKPHAANAYGAQMALDVVRLLDHLSLPQAHIVGYSMGAHIVAQLLTLHPERFITATLGGGTGRRDWTADDERRVALEAAEMERGSLATHLLRLSAAGQPKPDAAQIERLSADLLRGKDRLALAAVRRSNREQAVTAGEMCAVRLPVLGLVGSADGYRRDFDTLAALIPHLELVVIEGATHGSAPREPRFTEALGRFLTRHSAADGSDRSGELRPAALRPDPAQLIT